MASTVSQYLATFTHPIYHQRSVIINALVLADAQTMAEAQVAGTRWTVASIVAFEGAPHG